MFTLIRNWSGGIADCYRRRRWLRITSRAAATSVLLIVLACLLVEYWLIPRALVGMEHTLAKMGVHAVYRDPELKLLKGSLRVEELTLYRSADKSDPVLSLSKLWFRIDLKQLLFEKTLWGEGDVKDGRVVFYSGDREFFFGDVNADMDLDIDQIRITSLEGVGLGYRIAATGLVHWGTVAESGSTNPTSPPPATPAAAPAETYPEFPGGFGWMESLEDLFRCESAGPELPRLDLHIGWDERKRPGAADDGPQIPYPELTVDGSVQGSDVVWLNLPLRSIDGSFEMEAGKVVINDARFSGMGGEFTSAGVYDLATSQLTFESPISTMHPFELLGRLGLSQIELLSGIEFGETMPELSGVELCIDIDTPSESQIEVTIDAPEGFRYREAPDATELIELDYFHGKVSYRQAGEIRLEEIDGMTGGLALAGKLAVRWDGTPAGETTLANPTATSPDLEVEPTSDKPKTAGAGAIDTGSPPPSDHEYWMAQTVNSLLAFETAVGQPPRLEFDLIWDSTGDSVAAQASSGLRPEVIAAAATVSAEFSGVDFQWQDRPVESAVTKLELAGGVINVSQLEFSDFGGTLSTAGSFDFINRVLRISDLKSEVDLAVLKTDLGLDLDPVLDSIRFPSPPYVSASDIELHLDDPGAGGGKLELLAENGMVIGDGDETLQAQDLKLAMGWTGDRELTVEQVSVRIGGLEINSKGVFRWMDLAVGADGQVIPKAIPVRAANGGVVDSAGSIPKAIPVPTAAKNEEKESPFHTIALLQQWLNVETDGPPMQINTQFEWNEDRSASKKPAGELTAWDHLVLTGEISGKKGVWGELPVEEINAAIKLSAGHLHFTPFHLNVNRQEIRSNGSYDLVRHRLQMDKLRMTVDPYAALRELGVKPKGLGEWLTIPGSPVMEGNNLLLDFKNVERSSGRINIRFPSGIDLAMGEDRALGFRNVRGSLILKNGALEARDLKAQILKGDAAVNFRMALFDSNPWYEISLSIRDVSLNALNDWLEPGNTDIEDGSFDFQFTGKGRGGLESLSGSGYTSIDSDEPVAQNFPIIDGLVVFLEGLVPALKSKQAWTLDLPFLVKRGRVRVSDAKLGGPSANGVVKGSVDLVSGDVDVDVGINLRGLIGFTARVLTYLFRDNLIQIKGTGTLPDVKWELKR